MGLRLGPAEPAARSHAARIGADRRLLHYRLARLAADPAQAKRLGGAARRRLETHHPWPEVAGATLDFLARLGGPAKTSVFTGKQSADSLSSRAEPPC